MNWCGVGQAVVVIGRDDVGWCVKVWIVITVVVFSFLFFLFYFEGGGVCSPVGWLVSFVLWNWDNPSHSSTRGIISANLLYSTAL